MSSKSDIVRATLTRYPLLYIVISALALYLGIQQLKPSRRFPPGPKGFPFVGNALDFPKREQGRRFRDLSKQYGDIVHLKIFGQHIFVLGSYQMACDLLDKRSAVNSDRPKLVMGKLTSTDKLTFLAEYGPQWRVHRRVFHQELAADFVVKYQAVQVQTAHQLLHDLLEHPKSFMKHVERALAAMSLRIAYGLDLSEGGGEVYMHMLRTLNSVGGEFTVPGKFLVEAIPALQWLPGWLPGAGFKQQAATASIQIRSFIRQVFEAGKNKIECGLVRDSILARGLQRIAQLNEKEAAAEEEMCAVVTASTYSAGAETTEASIQAFILAMALYPDVQKKAQAELDKVVGSRRLPDFTDRQSLPYINALVKELTRWHIVAPTAIPHATIQDDEFNGYFIPKGSVVIVNLWAYSRDSSVYPDPGRFEPERFLKGGRNRNERDPYDFIFGFGRRVCPGRYLADAALFILCASILHVFEISPPVDADGKQTPLEAKFTDELITSHPEEFECQILPRNSEAAGLVVSGSSLSSDDK